MKNAWKDAQKASIAVDVAYYDQEHEEALSRYPTGPQIKTMVGQGIEISVEEFLTYFLFHKKRCVPGQYPRGYVDLRENIASAVVMLEDYVEWDKEGLRVHDGAVMMPTHVTEYIGESIGLTVVSRVHGLLGADWLPIETSPIRKTLDYNYASDGRRSIELEAKASVVEDVELKSPSISNQKRSIQDKKDQAKTLSEGPLLYGTIAAIPTSRQRVRCWLLDPTPSEIDRSPQDLRIIARMEFLRWIIWLIAPRSMLATALATRIGALWALQNPSDLSGVALTQADGTEFPPQRGLFASTGSLPFFNSRSRVADGTAGGVIAPTGRNSLLFMGMRADLLDLAASQNFEAILSFRAEVGSVQKELECAVPYGEFRRYDLDEYALPNFRASGGYARFTLEGMLRYSPEGLVFGLLPLTCA